MNVLSGVSAVLGVIGVGVANLIALQNQGSPVLVIPVINLTAVILGSVAMGAMFNRVRELERRMNKVQRRVFHEDDDEWDQVTERRKRPSRKF